MSSRCKYIFVPIDYIIKLQSIQSCLCMNKDNFYFNSPTSKTYPCEYVQAGHEGFIQVKVEFSESLELLCKYEIHTNTINWILIN